MSDRGVAVALVSVVIAGVLGLLLFVGAAGAGTDRGERSSRVFFGDRPPPAARTISQIQERVPAPVRSVVPAERQIALAVREAAGFLLVLLAVGTALVFAHGPVVAGYRATLGGWRTQARTFLLGGALLALIGSALFLMFVSMLGVVAGPVPALDPPTGASAAELRRVQIASLGPLLQVGVTAIAVTLVLIAVVAVVGLAAASWRIGDRLLGLRPLARFGQSAPPTLVALFGVTLIYVITQVPILGRFAFVAAVAYALGVVATARLAHTRRAI